MQALPIWYAFTVLTAISADPSALSAGHPKPNVEVEQRSPESIEQGSAATIEIIISNNGAAPALRVMVIDTLPPEHELVEATPEPERMRGQLLWSLGTLAPGEQRVLRLRLQLKQGTAKPRIVNDVTVRYELSASNTKVVTVKRPELLLTVKQAEGAAVGEPTPLQFTLRNAGTLPARDVTLQTLLPPGLRHPAGADLENEIGTLEVGQSRTLDLAVTPTRAGEAVVRVCATARETAPAEQEVRLQVHQTRLAVSGNGPSVCYPGWACAYEWTVRNDDDTTAKQLRVTAQLPEGIAFVRASDGAAYDAETHRVTWDVPELGAGEKRTLVLNGVARSVGDHDCQVLLTAGGKTFGQASCRTHVNKAAE